MVPDVGSEQIEFSLIGTNVVFSWSAPSARGTPITHYNVQVEA